ncbi:MAG: hypothetical protein PUB10_09110 [Clostridiales bacterium]|nr:hypothetical protein [Clostridiales bacterium]
MVNVVKQLVDQSDRIVVLSGSAIDREAGLYGAFQEERAYDIEARYHYSPEEIATERFWSTRSDLFYKYFRDYIVDKDKLQPQPSHWAIRNLEKRGKLSTVVTRSIYGLHQMAGIHNVIELHGSIHQCSCPRCGRVYPLDYILNSHGAAHCEQCRIVLKPGFSMYGDNVDNGKISMVAEAVSHADMLIMAGPSPDSRLAQYVIQYYQGDRLVMIHSLEHNVSNEVDYDIYGSPNEILPKIF